MACKKPRFEVLERLLTAVLCVFSLFLFSSCDSEQSKLEKRIAQVGQELSNVKSELGGAAIDAGVSGLSGDAGGYFVNAARALELHDRQKKLEAELGRLQNELYECKQRNANKKTRDLIRRTRFFGFL